VSGRGHSRDRWRDLVARWRGDARLGLALLVAVAVVAGVVWYRVGAGGASATPRSAPSRAGTTASSRPGAGTDPTTTTLGKRTVVHVAGAVARPGVVELAVGARVIDAVEAAGGGLPEADLDRLNLAAKVVDGQRVLVQRVGDPLPADATGTGTPGASPTPGAPTGGLLNLNTATMDQLDELPGIGPTLAAAILAERDERGGFKSVNELRDVSGIGEKRFADLRDLVSV
jgi:competence protein ComEA